MGQYKVNDRVKVIRADLDIFRKDEAIPGHDHVLVVLDMPDTDNPSQLGDVSLKESWLTRIEE